MISLAKKILWNRDDRHSGSCANVEDGILDQVKVNPYLARVNPEEVEAIARGEDLFKIYPEDLVERELDLPVQEPAVPSKSDILKGYISECQKMIENHDGHPNMQASVLQRFQRCKMELISHEGAGKNYIPSEDSANFLFNTIPLSGKASIKVDVFSSRLGGSSQENYFAKFSYVSPRSLDYSHDEPLGEFDRDETKPESKDFTYGLKDFLLKMGYNASLDSFSHITLNGYNDKHLCLAKMEAIRGKSIHQIPVMKEFLFTHYPSHYNPNGGEGVETLRDCDGAYIQDRFNKKVYSLRAKLKEQRNSSK